MNDLRIRPCAEPGFPIHGEIAGVGGEGLELEGHAAGKFHAREIAVRPLGRVAIAAGHDAVHEIGAAVDQRVGPGGQGQRCNTQNRRERADAHRLSPCIVAGLGASLIVK